MSFNIKRIIKENKDKIVIKKDNTKLIAWILGKCIAEDILSTTCECKNIWNIYDRRRVENEICLELGIPLKNNIFSKPERNIKYISLSGIVDACAFYCPYVPEII